MKARKQREVFEGTERRLTNRRKGDRRKSDRVAMAIRYALVALLSAILLKILGF